MRKMLVATALAGALIWPELAVAVLRSASLTITDQGRPIPGATIMLTRPHPRTARPVATAPQQPAPSQQAQPQPYQPAYQPPPEQPLGPTWVNVRSDAAGRLLLQYDDREARPGTVVDITVYYPNGEMRRLIDVPIEALLSGQPIDLAGAAGAPPSYSGQPSPYASEPPPDASGPPPDVGGILPGIVPGIGISIGGGRGGNEGRRER